VRLKRDRHHIYPRNYLKKLGYRQNQYNQIANYALTQSGINILARRSRTRRISIDTKGHRASLDRAH